MNNPIISIAKKWKKENASKKTGGKWALHAHLASLSFSFSYSQSFSLSLPYPTKTLGRPNTHFLLGLMIGSFFSCEHAITLFFFAPTSIPLLVVFGYDEWRETEKERERERASFNAAARHSHATRKNRVFYKKYSKLINQTFTFYIK